MAVQAQGGEPRYFLGVTQDPLGAHARWRNEYPDMHHWNIVKVYHNKSVAEGKRDLLVRAWGYEKLPEEDGPQLAAWHVYVFGSDSGRDVAGSAPGPQ